MHAVAYRPNAHFALLCQWLTERQLPSPNPEHMPEYGAVAYEDDKPIGMAFLRRVEGGFAQVDSLASNPQAPGELRHKALDLCISEMVRVAQQMEITNLIAFSRDKSAIVRSLRHGFVQHDDAAILSLDLNSRRGR
jgi:hypothetical protein